MRTLLPPRKDVGVRAVEAVVLAVHTVTGVAASHELLRSFSEDTAVVRVQLHGNSRACNSRKAIYSVSTSCPKLDDVSGSNRASQQSMHALRRPHWSDVDWMHGFGAVGRRDGGVAQPHCTTAIGGQARVTGPTSNRMAPRGGPVATRRTPAYGDASAAQIA